MQFDAIHSKYEVRLKDKAQHIPTMNSTDATPAAQTDLAQPCAAKRADASTAPPAFQKHSTEASAICDNSATVSNVGMELKSKSGSSAATEKRKTCHAKDNPIAHTRPSKRTRPDVPNILVAHHRMKRVNVLHQKGD